MSFLRFIVDDGKNFLSTTIENKSEIPALNVSIDIINESKNTPFAKSKKIKLIKSNYYKSSETGKLTIPAGTEGFFPLISVEELSALIGAKESNYCLYDASPEPADFNEKNDAFNRLYDSIPPEARRPQASTVQMGLRLKITYETIFKENITNYVLVFAHFTEKNSRNWVWYPTSKKIAPAQCINA
ncbi:hypothetical protein [Pseudomonas sp. MWU12-3103b]|uniref:hypothetical protein n=1 Tax=Pseudomonas sp. MWU12-3103b TaxID=2928857 RepID=UPI001FFE90A4|nr:hypothetical protein [Pseudomonas sp. MWU12-3103b]